MPVITGYGFDLAMPWELNPIHDSSLYWVDGTVDISSAFVTDDTTMSFYPYGGWEVGYRDPVTIRATNSSSTTAEFAISVSDSEIVTFFSDSVPVEPGQEIVYTFTPTQDIYFIRIMPWVFIITNISIGRSDFWVNFKGQTEI